VFTKARTVAVPGSGRPALRRLRDEGRGEVPRPLPRAGLLLAGLCLLGVPTASVADTETAYVKYRQSVMKAVGGNMAAIADVLKERLPLTGNVAAHARQLEIAGGLIEPAFEREVLAGKTEARPEIWENWVDFVALAGQMTQRSRELAQVAGSADTRTLAAHFKALARTCGQCHRKFRSR
jgi:cytochrome c556